MGVGGEDVTCMRLAYILYVALLTSHLKPCSGFLVRISEKRKYFIHSFMNKYPEKKEENGGICVKYGLGKRYKRCICKGNQMKCYCMKLNEEGERGKSKLTKNRCFFFQVKSNCVS